MTYKEREARLLSEMENRTDYNDGLSVIELCNMVLGYDMQVLNDRSKMENKSLLSQEEMNDYATKWFEDKKKTNQIKQMIIRIREKYRCGSKYINKHQYYLLPPRLQQDDKQWRCVHIIQGVNGQS